MKKLEELTLKEFISFYKFWKATWWQLTYRTKWLIKKSKELWLKLTFKKKRNRFIVWIQQQLLVWRQLQNPIFGEESYWTWTNHLIDKENYKEDNTKEENLIRLKIKWYTYYWFCTDLKWFVFSLIKTFNN